MAHLNRWATLVLLAIWLPTAVPAQPCTGDCSDDREVTVEEIVAMVNIALGNLGIARCPNGDSSGDDMVTVDELQAAIAAGLDGCPAGFAPRIDLSSTSGNPGQHVTITATLSGSLDVIVATSNDITYDRSLVQVLRTGDGPMDTRPPDCTIAPRLAEAKELLRSVLRNTGNVEVVRIGVFGINRELVTDGPLFTCNFSIVEGTASQVVTLDNIPGASNANARQIENRSCVAEASPLPCCSGPGTGSCVVGGRDGQIAILPFD